MTDSADSKEQEPVAGLSAASSSIRMSLSSPPPTTTTTTTTTTPTSSQSKLPLLPSFHPVFTHQCFDKECISGWRPSLEAEEKSQQIYRCWKENGHGETINGDNLHPSYQHCGGNDREGDARTRMDIHVILSPSCEQCRIEIQTEKHATAKQSDGVEIGQPAKKRVKTVSFEGLEPELDKDRTPQQQQMEISEVVKKCALALPPMISVRVNGNLDNELVPTTNDESAVETESKQKPEASADTDDSSTWGYMTKSIGCTLKSYHRKIKGASSNNNDADEEEDKAKFIITLADGSDPQVKRYHNAIQPLARWFIETADDVDVSDASRGSWKIMYLFRCHDDNNDPSSSSHDQSMMSLVGYITLLHVHSPFRKPRPGIIVRVCQALILPTYHRAGHGSEMLHALYEYADVYSTTVAEAISGMDILEVNVEDPAPAFVALRDSVDYARFRSMCGEKCKGKLSADDSSSGGNGNKSSKLNLDYLQEHSVTSKEYYFPVSEKHLPLIMEALKITKQQAQIVHEIYKLEQLEEWKGRLLTSTNNDTGNNNEKELIIQQVETNYRLMVKKSLRSHRMEELGACEGGKEGQKALLGKWFEETLRHYHRILGSKWK